MLKEINVFFFFRFVALLYVQQRMGIGYCCCLYANHITQYLNNELYIFCEGLDFFEKTDMRVLHLE